MKVEVLLGVCGNVGPAGFQKTRRDQSYPEFLLGHALSPTKLTVSELMVVVAVEIIILRSMLCTVFLSPNRF